MGKTDEQPEELPPFRGSYLQTLDDRMRLPFPAKLMPILKQIEGKEKEIEVVIAITKEQRLGVFPKSVFWKMINELKARPIGDVDAAKLRKTYINFMDEQVLDNQNRFRIPQHHAEVFELSGEVMVVGSVESVEVTTKEGWKKQLKEQMAGMQEQDSRVKKAMDPASNGHRSA